MEKRELIDLASQLQGIVDRLLETAKEETKEDKDDKEDEKPSFGRHGLIAMKLKRRFGD